MLQVTGYNSSITKGLRKRKLLASNSRPLRPSSYEIIIEPSPFALSPSLSPCHRMHHASMLATAPKLSRYRYMYRTFWVSRGSQPHMHPPLSQSHSLTPTANIEARPDKTLRHFCSKAAQGMSYCPSQSY